MVVFKSIYCGILVFGTYTDSLQSLPAQNNALARYLHCLSTLLESTRPFRILAAQFLVPALLDRRS
jgi:hypothetical protein